MSVLALEGVAKRFDTGVEIGPIDFAVGPGEIVAIVGASGVGKSTLLRIAAGLETADEGLVRLSGDPATAPGPDRVYLAQDAGLFPWLTVADNVSFGLSTRSATEKAERVCYWLDRVELPQAGALFPHQLSGGMRQRIALARALAVAPPVLLLDEPFAAIDTHTRHRMQGLLHELWEETKPAILMVTHDVEEAVLLAHRVMVLSGSPARLDQAMESGVTSIPLERLRLSDEAMARRRTIEAALAG